MMNFESVFFVIKIFCCENENKNEKKYISFAMKKLRQDKEEICERKRNQDT